MKKLVMKIGAVVHFANVCAGAVDWAQHQGNAGHTGYADVLVTSVQPLNEFRLPSTAGQLKIAVSDNTIFGVKVSTTTFWEVYSFNMETATLNWQTPIELERGSGSLSSVAISDSSVYVHRFGHSYLQPPAVFVPPAMISLDRQSGSVNWLTTHPGQSGSGSRPTVIEGHVFSAGGYYGGYEGYDSSSGRMIWSDYDWSPADPYSYSSGENIPASDGQFLYTYITRQGRGKLKVFNATTGGVAYEIPFPNAGSHLYEHSSPAVANGRAIVVADYNGHPDAYAALVGFDLGARQLAWTTTGYFTQAVATDGQVVAAVEFDMLSLIDANTGTRQREWTLDAQIVRPPVMTANAIFVGTADGTYGIDRDGDVFWTSPFAGSLAIADGKLFITSDTEIRTYSITPEPAGLTLLLLTYSQTRTRRR